MKLFHTDFTREQAEDCLSAIHPACPNSQDPYKAWSTIGRALRTHFGDSDGYDIFYNWSAGYEAFDKAKVEQQWKSFRLTKNVTIGSLIHIARTDYGWKPKLHDVSDISPEELKRQRAEQELLAKARIEKRQAEIAEEKLRRAKSLKAKHKIFESLPKYNREHFRSHYLHDDKNLSDITKYVDLRRAVDKHGNSHVVYALYDNGKPNGQFLGAEKIYNKRAGIKLNKFAWEDSKTDQGFCLIGEVTAQTKLVPVVGGLADAISVHKATQSPVAAAVGEGNILSIISNASKHYPHVEFYAAPDNDEAGQAVCERAADRMIQWSTPKNYGQDWNDVYRHHGIEQLEQEISSLSGWYKKRINVDYLSNSSIKIERGNTYIIDSEKETGKSTFVKEFVKSNPSLRVLFLSYSKKHLENVAQDFGADYYINVLRETHGDFSVLCKCQRLSICIDSLWKLAGSSWDVIFFDESEAGITNLTSHKMQNKDLNCDLLKSLILNTETVIFADADTGFYNISYPFLKRVGVESGIYIENNYKPKAGKKIYLYPSKAHLDSFINRSFDMRNLFIASNAKDWIERKHHEMRNRGLIDHQDMICITSKNSGKDEISQFIEQINNLAPKLKVFLSSPAITAGLDIKNHNFDTVVGYFSSNSYIPELALQHMARPRKTVQEYHVAISVDQRPRIIDRQQIKRLLIEKPTDETARLLCIDERGKLAVRNPLLEWIYIECEHRNNVRALDYEEYFIRRAEKEGFTVIRVSESAADIESAEQQDELTKEELVENFKAELEKADIAGEQEYLDACQGRSDISHAKFQKSKIYYDLGFSVFDGTPNEMHEVINDLALSEFKNERGGKASAIKRLSISAMPNDLAAALDRKDWGKASFITDIRHWQKKKAVQNKILGLVGIDENLNYNGYTWRRKDVDHSVRKLLLDIKFQEDLYVYWNISVTRATINDPMRWLHDFLTHKLCIPRSCKQSYFYNQETGKKDQRDRVYSIDEKEFKLVKKLTDQRLRQVKHMLGVVTEFITREAEDIYNHDIGVINQSPENIPNLPEVAASMVSDVSQETGVNYDQICNWLTSEHIHSISQGSMINRDLTELINQHTYTTSMQLISLAAQQLAISEREVIQELSSEDLVDIVNGNLTLDQIVLSVSLILEFKAA